MAIALPDRTRLKALQQRFLTINQERLQKVQAFLRPEQRRFLDLLPLLFHVNHPELPGYVSDNTPVGVSEYLPTPAALAAARTMARGFDVRKKAVRFFHIHSLFAMGSAGTVAYTEKSDFDMWLCHQDGLTAEQLGELQRKCTLIEQWGDTLGLEVHFFLMNAEEFRQGKQVELSEESSGTAQYHFLLDEFYRTGLLLAGRYPVWWLVPPESEGEYDEYVAALRSAALVGELEAIDFGGLGHIPAEEFYGASVWQVYKGIGSPYKSVLKILLMEAYTTTYPEVSLLSVEFKRRVHNGEQGLAELDPYLMLIARLEGFLRGHDDLERLQVARRCFYFKVNETLSKPDKRPENQWRFELLSGLAVSWGWDRAQLYVLDSRPTWKAERVMEERKALVGALTQTYHALSAFARRQAGTMMIDPRDLNLLGRKLYSAFERKAGKIDLINPAISADMSEERLTVYRMKGEQELWLLYRGDLGDPEARRRATPLKRAQGLIELVAWCYFNKILEPGTQVHAYARDGRLDRKDVQEVIGGFQQLFPSPKLPDPTMQALAEPARIVSAGVFINAGLDLSAAVSAQSMHLAQHTDVFSYGNKGDNLVQSVDMILITSWKEILTHHFTGEDAALAAIGEFLSAARAHRGERPPGIVSHCFSFFQGTAINNRVKGLFDEIVEACLRGDDESGEGGTFRYVTTLGRNLYLLERSEERMRPRKAGNLEQLYATLAQPSPQFVETRFGPRTLGDSPLPTVFARNHPGKVQLFYLPTGATAEVFVIDERGSLFRQVVEYVDAATLLSQYHRFLTSVLPRRDSRGTASLLDVADSLEYYAVGRNAQRQWALKRHTAEEAEKRRNYFNVQVIGEAGEGGRNLFTIYCNDREFSSLEHGNRLFTEIARSVLEQRNSGHRYPIYITDIDISRMLNRNAGGDIQTIQFLNYKLRIEQHLNDALNRL